MSIPLHQIQLKSDLVSGPVTVGVRHSLPVKGVDFILGNDLAGERVMALPCMVNCPGGTCDSPVDSDVSIVYPSCAVTRAMAKRAPSNECVPTGSVADDNDDVEPSVVDARSTDDRNETKTQIELADTILSHGRELEDSHKTTEDNANAQPFEIVSRDQLIELQRKDHDLATLQDQVVPESEALQEQVSYYRKSGVLMRRWRPQDAQCDDEWRVVNQIVVPKQLRGQILKLSHEGLLAGHLGINKTRQRILQNFYWPSLRTDVATFCKSCHVCQMAGKPNQAPQVAPLVPIPVVDEPFSRVTIDCVGPLPKTKSGNKYLSTVMCASTRFPEAIPLRNIKASNIVKGLIKFFTLVGLPKSIQSDQGTNFLSGVFQQVMYELGIKQFTSSAYHPQSQGALERFHQTLKSMLRTYCYEQDKDWDEGIHLLLFAAREAVQESLGFSPFELVFGREVRGPLKLLKESWLDEDHQVNLLEQVTQLRQRMMRADEIVRANLKTTQTKMKVWYDRKARKRSFQVGDEVLVLLPLHGHPLQARYSGPYTIDKKINDVDYIVKTPGRRKEKRLCHINMLKLYQARQGEVRSCNVVVESNETTIEASPKLMNSQILQNLIPKLEHLSPSKQEDMKQLLLTFCQLFPDVPGRTTCTYHDLMLGLQGLANNIRIELIRSSHNI